MRSGELSAHSDQIGSGLLPHCIDDLPETQVSALFGGTFTQYLKQQQRGSWTGPIESPYGAHLVRIDQVVESEVPPLAEIRGIARREWLVDRRRMSRDAMIDALREKYHITIADYETPGL